MSEQPPEIVVTQDGDATIIVLPPGQAAVYADEQNEQVVTGVLVVEATPGPRGLQGPPGPTGDQGPVGRTGDPGQPGPQGVRGESGLMGATGKQGKPGPPGIRGEQGKPGPQGRTGETGRTGERGPQGIPGKQGETGARGLPGMDGRDGVGVQGEDGLSAFEVAKRRGFRGTEAEWIAALRGPQGKTGERGLRGEKGDRGEVGPQGADGKMGQRGPAGGEGRFGQPGAPGAPGPAGPAGPAGAPGAAGSVWYTGVGVPAGGLGNDGDFYLDSASGDYYEKVGGVWVLEGNLKGPSGGGGASDLYVGLATEDIFDGAFCYTDGASQIALAEANVPGNQCTGFVVVGGPMGTPVTIYFEGTNTALTGLTPGARYYLSDTVAGACTDIPVRGAGKFHQYLGRAITATTLNIELDDIVRLAS